MRIGSLFSLPQPSGTFGLIRDEFGNNYSLPKAEIPEDAEEGATYTFHPAFEVQVSSQAQVATALKKV